MECECHVSGSFLRYIELSKALYRVIIADGNEVAAQQSAEDDWEEDSKGGLVMSALHFRDAIFQCVAWTSNERLCHRRLLRSCP